MIEITTKIAPGTAVEITGQLNLPYELRQKRWLRARLASGEEAVLKLRRGESLKGGDLLATMDGGAIEVVAAAEKVLHVECATPMELVRAAYHLGNRHVPLEVGDGYLRLAENHVLENLLRNLGALCRHIEAPFEPEAGAYSGAHGHGAETGDQSSRIHEFTDPDQFHG